MILDAAQLAGAGVGHDDLAGLHIPQKRSTGRIQRTALAGEDVAAAGQRTDAQRPVAARVTHCDELCGRHNDEAVSSFQHIHRLADGRLDAAHPQPVAGDEVADDLGIGGAVEDGTLVFQLAAKLQRIGQVAVVAQGHRAPAMPDDHGLGVCPYPTPGGGIADMAGGHVGCGAGHRRQHRRGKHLVHQAEVPVAGDDAIVVDGDAAALLAAMLQSVQG